MRTALKVITLNVTWNQERGRFECQEWVREGYHRVTERVIVVASDEKLAVEQLNAKLNPSWDSTMKAEIEVVSIVDVNFYVTAPTIDTLVGLKGANAK